MHILFIKAGAINESSGGGLESRKLLSALRVWCHQNGAALSVMSSDANADVCIPKRRWKDYLSRVFGHSSFLYIDSFGKTFRNALTELQPTVIVFDNSRLGCLVDTVKKHCSTSRLLVHFHNVELEYAGVVYAHKPLLSMWERNCVRKDEAASLNSADAAMFLTVRDKDICQRHYGTVTTDPLVMPVCLPSRSPCQKVKTTESLNFIFVGSLWYQSNIKAVEALINNVWPKVSCCYPSSTLTIAGSRPSKALAANIATSQRVYGVFDFDAIEDILPANAIMLSPIADGAGMKVKVAQALSWGVPVIASKETLAGYQQAISDIRNAAALQQADSVAEIIQAIKFIEEAGLANASTHAHQLFAHHHSQTVANKKISRWLDRVVSSVPH